MNHRKEQFKKTLEYSLPWLFLALLLAYTYAKFFQHPYGFAWDPNGDVDRVFVNQEPALMVGDHLVQVGPLDWETFHADLRRTFFENVRPGETVPITVDRNGGRLTIPWQLPGFNQGELNDQLFSEWPLAYVFWLAGTLTLLFLRPKDDRWFLLSAFNFLTAAWLAVGGGASGFHIWNSALILRMAIWLSVPVYLHLHWVFPRPLGKLPPLLVVFGYVIALGLMIAQWFQLFSQDLYFLGFLIAIFGSFILLVAHAFRQPDTRRELRLLLLAVFFILIPIIILAVIQTYSGTSTRIGSLALLSFPLLPAAYLYAAYRRQLGGLEVRVNRLMSAYFFVILLGAVGLPLLAFSNRLFTAPDDTLVMGSLVALTTTVLSIWGFPAFQNFVERRWLGISLPSRNLQETYSSRITTSTSLHSLLQLLNDDVFPSLLIRQFVFLQVDKGTSKMLLASGVTDQLVPPKEAIPGLESLAGKYLPADQQGENRNYPWARLILPLHLGDELTGLWLLGRRDPDDIYSQGEIPILQSLANQTAIALSNILQTERLKAVYEANIDRYEQERRSIARDLHDSVLNQMAAMLMELDNTPLSPGFQEAYNTLAQRLREIVSDLRPPMLHYGLKPAFEELADNLMERSRDAISVVVDVESDDKRYGLNIEQNLYRIAQEACENAYKHAQANKILIHGKLNSQNIDLTIEDDGTGFDTEKGLRLDDMLANKHYGLIGMVERANLIGAEIAFQSIPNAGMRVHVKWHQSS
ncbi:MAG: hypothetical protein HZB19_17780 [Chloroflexi bacterium]|nr:hypothetical protein [Chloroflexota bacterium]